MRNGMIRFKGVFVHENNSQLYAYREVCQVICNTFANYFFNGSPMPCFSIENSPFEGIKCYFVCGYFNKMFFWFHERILSDII